MTFQSLCYLAVFASALLAASQTHANTTRLASLQALTITQANFNLETQAFEKLFVMTSDRGILNFQTEQITLYGNRLQALGYRLESDQATYTSKQSIFTFDAPLTIYQALNPNPWLRAQSGTYQALSRIFEGKEIYHDDPDFEMKAEHAVLDFKPKAPSTYQKVLLTITDSAL